MKIYHISFFLSAPMKKGLSAVTLMSMFFSLGACSPVPSQPNSIAIEPDLTPPPAAVLFFYPNQGQSEEQQDRDQYECYLWATQQTGFDPSNPNLAPHHRVEFVPEPASRHGTALGAAAGAVIGAAVTSRSNPAKGAVVGAVAGAMLGAASDASREEEARRRQQQYDQETADRYAESEIKANNYRRAQEACLEGRGYTVR